MLEYIRICYIGKINVTYDLDDCCLMIYFVFVLIFEYLRNL